MSASIEPRSPAPTVSQASADGDGGTLPVVLVSAPMEVEDSTADEARSAAAAADGPPADASPMPASVAPSGIVTHAVASAPAALPNKHPPGLPPADEAENASQAQAVFDRYVLAMLADLREQAEELHTHSRRMKHHKKACFTLGDKASALLKSMTPPFKSSLFIMHIVTESKILFESISGVFVKVEKSTFLGRRRRLTKVENTLNTYAVELQKLQDLLDKSTNSAAHATNHIGQPEISTTG
ncbi:hypothetical protein AURDEDRAFT_170453 [Auricularia subglabra TFB-10046 SS5]|nr:hypothetical protein AURDEDRAFT_170453 [Auricularia subglabra TFB-10046 SS5]